MIKATKKENITKLTICLVLVAMVIFSISNRNPEIGSDCITSGQIVMIQENQTPLSQSVSKTTTKVDVKTSIKTAKLKEKAKVTATKVSKSAKTTTSNKAKKTAKIKIVKTVLTTTTRKTQKASLVEKINVKVKTTIKTTTTTTKSVVSGKVSINAIASKADKDVRETFEDRGYVVIIKPEVTYAGKFSTFFKTIEVKTNNTAIYHELGHYVSFMNHRAADSSEFKAIYKAEKSKYKGYNRAYVTQSSGEYFAEAFSDYTLKNSTLKKNQPKTYAFVKKCVNQI
ncbi:MAG: hypothetical protein RSD88_05475 [Anaerovoracaceae bacterium]